MTFRPAVWEAVVAGCLTLVICAAGASQLPLIGQDEARFAQAAREMYTSGEWVVPSFGGEPRYDKPILIYWLTMASYSIFGISAWAARLPSQIAAALLVAMIAYWARRRFDAGGGLLAGLLLLSCPVFFIEARASTADMVMLLPTVLAMLLVEGLWSGRGGWFPAGFFWVVMAVSVLAKGPIGPAVVVATLVALWAAERTWTVGERAAALTLMVLGYAFLGPLVLIAPLVLSLFSKQARQRIAALKPQWGVPLFLALVLPWVCMAHLRSGGAYFAEALGHHVIERGLSPLESHGGFPGFYLVTGIVVLFPWCAGLVSRFRQWDDVREDWSSRFYASWFLGTLVMLEMMQTRMVHYLLPCVVAGVLLVSGRPHRGHMGIVVMGAFVLAMVPIVSVVVLDIETLRLPALGVALPLFAGFGCCVFGRGRERGRRYLVMIAVSSLAFLVLLVSYFMPMLAETFIVGRTVAVVNRQLQPGEELVVYKLRDDELLFSLPLHTSVERSRENFGARIAAGERFFGIARQHDLKVLIGDDLQSPVKIVDIVEGVDLSRGRWTTNVLFRVRVRAKREVISARTLRQ